MGASRSRRVTLADALILIAILSLAMASLRTTWHIGDGWYLSAANYRGHGTRTPLGFLGSPYTRTVANGAPLLVLASLAVACLRIRRTLPVRMSLAGQPGLVLCAVIVAVAAVTPFARPIPSELAEIPDIRALVYGSLLFVWALFAVVCLTIRGALQVCMQWVRHSGSFICLTIIAVTAVAAVANPIHREPWEPWEIVACETIVFGLITNEGYTVLCMRALLEVTGRYGPVQSTADWLGRILAWIWVLLLILERGRLLLEMAQVM